MEENKENASAEEVDEKERDEKLPFCTTAPSAEHARGEDDSFIDNTIQNGRTYYYAIVAYDYGVLRLKSYPGYL